jgi:hypothetical protein
MHNDAHGFFAFAYYGVGTLQLHNTILNLERSYIFRQPTKAIRLINPQATVLQHTRQRVIYTELNILTAYRLKRPDKSMYRITPTF